MRGDRLALFAGLAAIAALSVGSQTPDRRKENESAEVAATPETLLERLNRIRRDRGLPKLRAEPVLAALAVDRAASSQAGPLDLHDATRRDRDAAERAGYPARTLAELYVGSEGGADAVLANALQSSDFDEEVARAENTSVGIGAALREEMPIYVFLFASSQVDFLASKAASLGDLMSVRRDVLARVNGERASARLPPLRAHPRLDEAALRHAQDMLARAYYGHVSPDGRTPLDRGRAAGYRTRAVGENIARGPASVPEVMDAWMKSPEHRAHILSPAFRETGSAVAVGPDRSGYQVIWVQCFGRPAEEPVVGPARRR